MKSLKSLIIVMLFTVFGISAKAQIPVSYYVGKWDVTVGIPGGDKKMGLALVEKEGKLSGDILDAVTGKVTTTVTKVEQEENTITVYFEMSGHNVYIAIEKKDEDNFTASMLDMFECKGKRIVEAKK